MESHVESLHCEEFFKSFNKKKNSVIRIQHSQWQHQNAF